MAVETWTYQYGIAASPEKVYEYLSDPQNYLKLSPLVVAITNVHKTVDVEGHQQVRYSSIERFKFLGLIRYDNPIDVVMTFMQPGQQMICDVQGRLGVSVQFVYDLKPEANQILMTETITARMPIWVRRFVVSQAKMVQQFRARTLNEELSGPL